MSTIPAEIPLFPLPDHVLLLGLPEPFRIFEPRYRALVQALLERQPEERWLAIPRLEAGWEAGYDGSPAFAAIAAAALVKRIEPMPGGEFQILVEGVQRCRLTEIPSSRPFRVARVQPLLDVVEPESSAPAMRALLDLLRGLGDRIDLDAHGLQRLLAVESAHPQLIDRLGALVLRTPANRQHFLECLDFTERIALVQRTLAPLAAQRLPPSGRWKPSAN